MAASDYWKKEHNRLHSRIDKDAVKLDKIYKAALKKALLKLRAFNKKYPHVEQGDTGFVSVQQQKALISNLRRVIYELNKKSGALIYDSLDETYLETEAATYNQIGTSFEFTNEEAIRAVINTEFKGSRFSKRIHKMHEDLPQTLFDGFSKARANGENWHGIQRILVKKHGTSDYQARRLLITESARINSIAKQKSFSDVGYKYYKIMTVHDDRRSEVCNEQNGKVYEVAKMEIGVNAPPFHVYCRSTIAPATSRQFNAKK